jgi:hypothetical protein
VLAGGYTLLRLHELDTGKELRRLALDEHPEKLPKPTFTLPGHQVHKVGLSPDGRTVASISTMMRQVAPNLFKGIHVLHVWDLATGRSLARREQQDEVHHLNFAPGAAVVVGYSTTLPPLQERVQRDEAGTTSAVLEEVSTGRRLLTLPQPDNYTGTHAVAPDGRTLATVTVLAPRDSGSGPRPATLRLWELASGQERLAVPLPIRGPRSSYYQLAFAPDGRRLAAVRSDRTVELWDMATGREEGRRSGFGSIVTSLAFTPDGQSLATGHRDGTILVWDLPLGNRPANGTASAPETGVLEGWWSALAGGDARKAHEAVWAMIGSPEPSVALLRSRMQPVAAVAAAELRQLVADLDSAEFARREAASRRLAELGERAEPALREASKSAASPEQRRRIDVLLAGPRVIRSGEPLRQVRAVEVLEHIGTPKARQVLQKLAEGAPEARMTQEAKRALQRLARR